MKKILFLLLGAFLLFCSCIKKEINQLKGTTWINEFKESERVDAKADAYCFGTDATFFGREEAITFTSGYGTNSGVLSALLSKLEYY